jgi:hypothetical protein
LVYFHSLLFSGLWELICPDFCFKSFPWILV